MHMLHGSMPFLLLASRFTTFRLGHAQKWKPTSLGFSIFGSFFGLSFFSFSFLFAAVIDLLLGLPGLKNFQESIIETGNFYHGAARCSGRKFWSEFFAQLFEHFCAYLRLHWADHSDLGIIGKIFFLLQKLSIDDANFGQKWWRQKWKKGQGSKRRVTGGTGVNGLKTS